MAYRAATPDVPAPPRVHSATWVAIALGFTSLGLSLAGLYSVVAFGLFSEPPGLALLPVAAAAFNCIATISTVHRARRLSRAPRRHSLALVLAGLAIVVTAFAAFAWIHATLYPPEPMHFQMSPGPSFNRC